MAKKAKPTKKVVKKAAAKKPAKPAKKANKKVSSKPVPKKKAAKPVKKAVKTVNKKSSKPVAKKTVKKVAAKKAAAPKKTTKPVVKKVAAKKKPIQKKTVKKITKSIAKKAKPIAKKIKPVKKVVKPIAKKVTKSVVKPVSKAVKKASKPVVAEKPKKEKVIAPAKSTPIPAPVAKIQKPAKVAKSSKKRDEDFDLDDDGNKRKLDEMPMVVEYKTPSIRRPLGPTPKPFINKDTRTRYSDSELKEFKELILKKLGEAQRDYELLKSTLSHRDDHGTDDTSPTFKLLEDGSDVLSKEETAHLASRQEKFIQNLQNALIRIENKTYGICRQTGKLISKERLRSVPHATLAIEAKLGQHS
jgi:RNA polymerase-binding transcription factor DksA